MSDTAHTTAVVSHASEESHQPGFLTPDIQIILLTWITFFGLLAILSKFAWKPILAALDSREAAIRKAIEDADKAKEELEKINQTRAKLIAEAELKSRDMLEQSRKAAVEAAKTIEHKARNESQIMVENALREIKAEKEKVQAQLRVDSAQIVVELASKLIQENLDNKKNRELVDKLIKEI